MKVILQKRKIVFEVSVADFTGNPLRARSFSHAMLRHNGVIPRETLSLLQKIESD